MWPLHDPYRYLPQRRQIEHLSELPCGKGKRRQCKLKVANFSNTSFINSHYLTGGATVYTSSGYEYATRSYANVAFFEHDLIGTAAAPGTGDGGPCVGCHMTPGRHTFKPVTFAPGTETITSIASTVCAVCHTGGFALTPAGLNTEKEDHDAALAALDVALQARGFFFSTSNPYFFKGPNGTGGSVTNWLSTGDADTTGNTTGKNNMGAAFNLNLLNTILEPLHTTLYM